jgi:hypothetical protein
MATQEQVYQEVGRAHQLACLLEMNMGTLLLTLDALETGS